MKPLIHLNGNSKESLLKELKTAKESINNSIVRVEELTVHSRNYYPLENGDNQFQKDCSQVVGWLKELNSIEKQIEDSIIHIAKQ